MSPPPQSLASAKSLLTPSLCRVVETSKKFAWDAGKFYSNHLRYELRDR